MEPEKRDVYGITGFFVQGSNQYYFGGFFSTEKEVDFFGKEFRGDLIDHFGMSDIQGKLINSSLIFDKKYNDRQDIIHYDFKMNENRLWVGNYSSSNKSVGNGIAICRTHLDFENVNFIIRDYVDIENWVTNLVEGMVREGIVKVVSEDTPLKKE